MRHYGKWMRDEAHKRIGHLYPSIEITADMATDRPRSLARMIFTGQGSASSATVSPITATKAKLRAFQ